MPLSAFWQRLNFGETLSEEVEKVLGYLVAKYFLGPKMPLSAFWQRLIMARHFQRKQKKCLATWYPSTFCGSTESVSPKLSFCQNAESSISWPRKFLVTFNVSRQNTPLVNSFQNSSLSLQVHLPPPSLSCYKVSWYICQHY